MNRFVLAVALAAAVPVASLAQAAHSTADAGTYFQVKLGTAIPQHSDVDAYDPGLAFEVAMGFPVNRNVAFEVALGRFSIGADGTFFDPNLGVDVSAEETASAIPLTGSVKLGTPVGGSGFLYGMAGAGLYFVSDDVKYTAPGYGNASVDDSATAFGLHFGGGFSAQLAPQWSIGAELRYIISEVELYDVKSHIDSLIVTGALGYRF